MTRAAHLVCKSDRLKCSGSGSKMPNSELIGASPKFRAVLEEIQIVSPVDCTVLLRGETGTGKEVVTQAIHDASPRRRVNTVASANCTVLIHGETGTGKEQLYRENLALRDDVDRASMFEEIVGPSKPLKTVLARIVKVAPTDSS